MRGTKTIISKLTLLSVGATALLSAATTTDYLPLMTGNSWVYRVTQGKNVRAAAINIGYIQTINGREYQEIEFFDQKLLVRRTDDGSVVRYNTDTKTEDLFLPFALADIQPAQGGQTSFDACTKAVQSVRKDTKLTTPLGEFSNVLEIRYTSSCADAGVTAQYFLPFVGLLRQEETSIAGPVVYDLIYSRTGITNVNASTVAFTTALDAPYYKSGQDASGVARLTLRASEPIKLTFPSGQTYGLQITNEKGDVVYQYGIGILWIQVVREEMTGPGDKSWAVPFPVGDLPPGKYTAEAWLTTQPRQYSASVGFEVR